MKKFLILSLAIMLCVMSFIPVSYAEEEYPAIDTLIETHGQPTEIIIDLTSSGYYHAYLFYDIDNKIETNGAYFTTGKSTHQFGGYAYILTDGTTNYTYKYVSCSYEISKPQNGWSSGTPQTTTGTKTYWKIGDADRFIYSTFDIYDVDGTLLFQGAPVATELYQMIQAVTNQEIPTLTTKVAGAMKTLVLCGVGCLALLMVLPLFGKVLNRYR